MPIQLSTQKANVVTGLVGAGSRYEWLAPATGSVTISVNYTMQQGSPVDVTIFKNSASQISSIDNPSNRQVGVQLLNAPCEEDDVFEVGVTGDSASNAPNFQQGVITVEFTEYPT